MHLHRGGFGIGAHTHQAKARLGILGHHAVKHRLHADHRGTGGQGFRHLTLHWTARSFGYAGDKDSLERTQRVFDLR